MRLSANNIKYLFGAALVLSAMLFSCSSDDISLSSEENEEGSEETEAPSDTKKDCKPWNDFVAQNRQNVLLDFSYAGYKHGEMAPAEVETLNYRWYDITHYGGIPDDGKSDRQALLRLLADIEGIDNYAEVNAVIYFPEGEFILHDEQDGVTYENETIRIKASNVILKGAGRNKTFLVLKAPNPIHPAGGFAYNTLSLEGPGLFGTVNRVVVPAAKGSFSVELSSVSGLRVGEYACLHLKDNSRELIERELLPYKAHSGMTGLLNDGVVVQDYHLITKIEGNVVTFKEPIMHEVDPQWNWDLRAYSYVRNIGVEDMTFRGDVPVHYEHLSWLSDTGYIPFGFRHVVDGWVRRVDFDSVSEAATFTMAANCSAYDIRIIGKRGHCAVRSFGSSRIFMGKIMDFADSDTEGEKAGMLHTSGVSRPAMGTVIWRCRWGDKTCFESHGSQPRATLLDACKGGFPRGHQGGAMSALPNHMQDLTLWNFNATASPSGGNFSWWEVDPSGAGGFLFLPPVIVGFHGAATTFKFSECKLISDNGKAVAPESLYEAQLQRRLGRVPEWIGKLKEQKIVF